VSITEARHDEEVLTVVSHPCLDTGEKGSRTHGLDLPIERDDEMMSRGEGTELDIDHLTVLEDQERKVSGA
jgi:hypothetical protein